MKSIQPQSVAVEVAASTARTGSSDAYALSELAHKARPLVVFCARAAEAARLRDEIAWFDPKLKLCVFPDWETLPYDSFSPHQDLVSERLATLYQIQRREFDVVVLPAATALQRLAPLEYLAAYTFFLKQGETLGLDALRAQLVFAGYQNVSQVVAPGEFCVRGGIIDLFPMGSVLPYRIDLMDETIDGIRTFDVDTQRTIYKVGEIRLLPAREFPTDEAGRNRFRSAFREQFEGDPSKSSIYKDVSNGVSPAGIEYWLPLFFEKTATLFDYLPPEANLCMHDDVHASFTDFWRDTQSRYQFLRGERDRPLLPPGDLFLTAEEFFIAAKRFARADASAVSSAFASPQSGQADADSAPPEFPVARFGPLPKVAVERRANDPLVALKNFLSGHQGRTLLLADSPGRRETLIQYLHEYDLAPVDCGDYAAFQAGDAPLMLCVAPLLNGFLDLAEAHAFITEAELFSATARSRSGRTRERQTSVEGMLRDLSELRAGDPVVHLEHGIGRYRGLIDLDLGEGKTEFLLIEYAEADKLYVPVSQLHLIGRYSGGPPEQAPLHRLGGEAWEKAKGRAAKQVRDTAAELLNLYAQRASRQGRAFTINHHDLEAFAESFGFDETPDQLATINAVIEDMKQGKPMDRLVCGDVGFGKTEVALRAAFVAVADGMQVAILAPTTLLSGQHYQTFSDRFAGWPVKIAELSRFRSGAEQNVSLEGIANGTVDIAIGTHKLLSREVKFSRLGLVIVDEEHRFGVRQKEALKALRAEVDVLTLTATPIPRTLAMSLEGLRDFSVIATAPEKRLAIKTFVTRDSAGIIREACLRELKRGGQIYFLHNEVATIERMQQRLAEILPEARIAIAHGQMRERDLERVMREFLQQRHNLLLCSTIIETGIDIPTANTIIINRADNFGLAQLHQLRGRVGRSHHQAYAYLLTPEERALSSAAKKRLEAIQMMEQLGSGFYLAMQDLEIRGAGEVLGDSQSGEMQEIGFNLFNDMLSHAVRSLKSGKEPDLSEPLGVTTEINLHIPALMPTSYCEDVHERLVVYKRLANCDDLEQIEAMQEEMVDRFGQLHPAARALLEVHRLRIRSKNLGIKRLDAGPEVIQIVFVKHPPIEPETIISLIRKQRGWRMSGPDKLRIERVSGTLEERTRACRDILALLSAPATPAAAVKNFKPAKTH